MLRSLAVSVLFAALIAAPARADDVRAAIEAGNAKFMADYAAGDTKALALAYTEDAVMLPPDATRVAGHAAIEASLEELDRCGDEEPDFESYRGRFQRRFGLRNRRIHAASACRRRESYDRHRQLRRRLEARQGRCLANEDRHLE